MTFLKERINKIFEDTLRNSYNNITYEGTWSPAIDLYETETEFVAEAEIPELRQDDISVRLDSNILTIEGERKADKHKIDGYFRMERPYGRFKRSFVLPDTVDVNIVKASLDNGILRIILPKKEVEHQRHIEIGD